MLVALRTLGVSLAAVGGSQCMVEHCLQAFTSSASQWKASEPAFQHEEEEGAFQVNQLPVLHTTVELHGFLPAAADLE